MYIAGLNIPINLTNDQGIEGIVVLSTLTAIIKGIRTHSATAAKADKEGGAVKTLPTSFIGQFVTQVHGIVFVSTPLVYLIGVTFNGLEQPWWLEVFNFPITVDAAVGVGGKAWLRIAACVGVYGCTKLFQWTMGHLGAQWHYIGRRERPQIVSTGPYAYVRHPMYTVTLLEHIVFAGMFWSYAPLVGLGIVAAAFAIKMPIEERLIEDDPKIGPDYKEYKKRVTARIIPYIW